MDSTNLVLSIVSTLATVVSTVIALRQIRATNKPEKESSHAPDSVASQPARARSNNAVRSAPAGDRSVQFGPVWLALACFPWLNFIAWIWAGFKAKNPKFWVYAVLYCLPFLIFGISYELTKAAQGADAKPPQWTAIMGALSWIVGIVHAIATRDKSRQSSPDFNDSTVQVQEDPYLRVPCNCGANLKVKRHLEGKTIQCPRCKNSIFISVH